MVKPDLLQYIACPLCGSDLHANSTEESQTSRLFCASGCGSYPVEDGVPRLLPELCRKDAASDETQHQTKDRFGAQWRMFEYGETTWGITPEQRINVACHEMQWAEASLQDKVILDAGCGNGTLSKALADRGAVVVAADLSDSVFRAQAHCSSPNLHFVQANMFYPPFRRQCFDGIYSCGVFHHTPDTRRCFDALTPCLRSVPEARFFIWLYARRSALFDMTVEQLMKVTRRLPPAILVPMCYALAPGAEIVSRLLTRLGLLDYGARTLKDRAVQLHDLFSPPFVWYHTVEEVRHWATAAGFRQVDETEYQPGEEVSETARRTLRQYQSYCRPGFGVLCREPVLDRSDEEGAEIGEEQLVAD